jgi:hypothetical protein
MRLSFSLPPVSRLIAALVFSVLVTFPSNGGSIIP